MHALPLLLAASVAGLVAPGTLRALTDSGHLEANYRDRMLPMPFGVLVVVAALIALVPLLLIERVGSVAVLYPGVLVIAVYVLGVAMLGLIDDLLGSAPEGRSAPRGWRGHGRALLSGELSTGTVKAVGSLGLALLATSFTGLSTAKWLLASGVLVLATNLFNLLDLRPGRATKAFVLLGVGLAVGSMQLRPLWSLGLFVGPALVAGIYDMRERAMLGDTGANLIGALAGLWLVAVLSTTGQLIALALLVLITIYGELHSISELVEKTPGLRELDSWGRNP